MSDESFRLLKDIAGHSVSRETYQRLKQFEAQFLRWTARINLAAPSTLGDVWQRHILDSAQLSQIAPERLRWLDLGSGGGFPGAVMAVLLSDRGGATIDLVESNRKKAAFLQTVLAQLRAPARVHAVRIEDAASRTAEIEVVTARALAPLDRLLGLAFPWLEKGARALFHKGRDYRSEIEESVHAWDFDLLEHRSRIDPDSVILELSNVRKR